VVDDNVSHLFLPLPSKALFKMRSIDQNAHQLFSRVVDFSQKLSSRATNDGNAASEQVISSEFPTLMNDKSLADFVQSAVNKAKADASSSLPLRIVIARAILSANVGSASDACSLIFDSKLNIRCVAVETCQEALEFMESLGNDGAEAKERMKMLIAKKFPFAKDY
jgi:hypothetical protein